MENVKWGCEKCGGRFDLDSPSGRCSAHYGVCRKCFCEIQLEVYKGANILQKILYFIPHIIILICYRHYYGKKKA